MPHPKKKTTKAARNQRRSHHALKTMNLVKCEKCSEMKKSHCACSNCGYYKGKEVINVLKKLPRKERLKAEKTKKKQQEKTDLKKTIVKNENFKKKENQTDRKEGAKSVVRGDK